MRLVLLLVRAGCVSDRYYTLTITVMPGNLKSFIIIVYAFIFSKLTIFIHFFDVFVVV